MANILTDALNDLPHKIDHQRGRAANDKQAWRIADWTIRNYLPTWLAAAGHKPEAQALRALPEVASTASLSDATEALRAARWAIADEPAEGHPTGLIDLSAHRDRPVHTTVDYQQAARIALGFSPRCASPVVATARRVAQGCARSVHASKAERTEVAVAGSLVKLIESLEAV